MNWKNVILILRREVRDQLRDRRTLFMIAVLPLVLYPLMGMSFLQIAQFMREHATQVLIIGAEDFGDVPPLVEGNRFAVSLFSNPSRVGVLKVETKTRDDGAPTLNEAHDAVLNGEYEAVLYFPPDFADRLASYRAALVSESKEEPATPLEVPKPIIICNTAKDKSQLAYNRVYEIVTRWTDAIGRQNLERSNVPATAAKPFELGMDDVAPPAQRQAAMWSNILPFVLLLWALTGAFYPAVDLCAGEKERGTLETLLSSPAERSEIVWGKLLTIMMFSMATAILNLASMGITGSFVLRQFEEMGPPPLLAFAWLMVALVPVAALYSALCLALAAFARSTKEGQYYLMPLVLITMPLTILPMAPGVELNLGNSLIPITGIVLLLRNLLEGNYAVALPYVPMVAGVTLGCCLLAVRWAADQFNSEAVLFRESERFDLGLWFKHLLRDREDTPSATEAIFGGVLILMVQFFMSFALQSKTGINFISLAVITQLVVIATPALLMTLMLTRSPRKTLLLAKWPGFGAVGAAALLAVSLHPLINWLGTAVEKMYPIPDNIKPQLEGLMKSLNGTSLPLIVLVIAVVPAICEELAFRGFVLSGLRHLGHKWRAIAISSIFFGLLHPVFQQSVVASIVGMFLGYIAVQTGSILPGVIFHVINNSLALVVTRVVTPEDERFNWLLHYGERGLVYGWPAVLAGTLISAGLVWWFRQLPHWRSEEESLQEAIDHQSASSMIG